MKLRQIFLLLIVIVLVGLIYYPIISTEDEEKSAKTEEKPNFLPTLKVNNENRVLEITSYGQILPNNQLDINMEVQGEIERDNRTLKVGESFKKGDVLIKIDRTEALYNLLSRRSAFINLIASLLPDISLDLPEEKEKWENYLNNLNPAKELSMLPDLNSRKEQLLVTNRNIPSEFYSLKALEEQVGKYYYIAPFTGTVVNSFVEPGTMVTPGMRIATIAKTNDYEVKAPINANYLAYFSNIEEVNVETAQGLPLGTAKLIRKASFINEQTQSIDAFFRLNPVDTVDVYQGMFVNLNITAPLFTEVVVLPENAVLNEKVQILRDSVVIEKNIQTLGSNKDSVFVKGIDNNEELILEPVQQPSAEIKYVGIQRN